MENVSQPGQQESRRFYPDKVRAEIFKYMKNEREEKKRMNIESIQNTFSFVIAHNGVCYCIKKINISERSFVLYGIVMLRALLTNKAAIDNEQNGYASFVCVWDFYVFPSIKENNTPFLI